MKLALTLFAAVLALTSVPAHAADAKLDPALIEKLTGLHGKLNEKENVFKVSYPRKDLHVTAQGATITPAMGLTAWAAFTPSGDHLMVMGDLVLTEEQVGAVMSAALDAGLAVTALHNHFFWDTPKIMFMHIGGMGDQEKLASSVGKVFAKLKGTAALKIRRANLSFNPAKTTLDPKKINAVLGAPGELKDGVYKVTFGRTTEMDGHKVGGAMGVNTWAAFVGSDDQALVDGDFAMLEGELQGVLKALRGAGIQVVAIHNHMTMENPRIVFLHYWGVGSTADLAKALKSALDTQKRS